LLNQGKEIMVAPVKLTTWCPLCGTEMSILVDLDEKPDYRKERGDIGTKLECDGCGEPTNVVHSPEGEVLELQPYRNRDRPGSDNGN